jgi:hypothetical protein
VVDVGLQVRDRLLPLRVHGPRFFVNGLLGVTIGPAAKFRKMPLVYEKAYGGATADYSVVEDRNPAGVGVHKRPGDLVDRPAPQIEHPLRPHISAKDKHAPAGFCAIMSHWSPRRELAGTCDAVWQATRMPLMPRDFDVRHNNVAHPSLLFETPLVEGDVVSVTGMSVDLLRFELPRMPVVFRALSDVSGLRSVPATMDTVVVEPSRRTFDVVARAVFPIGRGKDVLRELRVDVDAA